MALPWQKVKSPGMSIAYRKPDEAPEAEMPQEDNGLEAAAADILQAQSSGDAKALASALKAFFDICQSQPEPEAGGDDFDSLNAAAAAEGNE